MNDAQLIDRLAGTDAYAADVPVPDEIWTPDVALREIERRTAMQTDERKIQELGGSPPAPRGPRRRSLAPAMAAALAVVVAVVVAIALLAGGDEEVPDVGNTTVPVDTTTPEPAALTPLEVGEALNQAAVAGDWEAVRALYAEEATFSIDVGDISDSSIISNAPLAIPFPPGRPTVAPFPILNQFDWDDDGVISGFDDIAATTMTLWALGVEPYRSCSEVDATTLVCDERGQGPFSSPPDLPIYSEIFTVVDGRITQHILDLSDEDSFSPVGFVVPPLPVEYEDWVRENRAELNPDGALFEFLGKLLITPDTVEVHRQLIAEWVAQR